MNLRVRWSWDIHGSGTQVFPAGFTVKIAQTSIFLAAKKVDCRLSADLVLEKIYVGDCRTPLYWKSDKGIPTPCVHTYLVPLYNTLDIYNTGVIIPDPPSDEVGR